MLVWTSYFEPPASSKATTSTVLRCHCPWGQEEPPLGGRVESWNRMFFLGAVCLLNPEVRCQVVFPGTELKRPKESIWFWEVHWELLHIPQPVLLSSGQVWGSDEIRDPESQCPIVWGLWPGLSLAAQEWPQGLDFVRTKGVGVCPLTRGEPA